MENFGNHQRIDVDKFDSLKIVRFLLQILLYSFISFSTSSFFQLFMAKIWEKHIHPSGKLKRKVIIWKYTKNFMLSIAKCFPGGKILYYRHIWLRGRVNRRTENFPNISDKRVGSKALNLFLSIEEEVGSMKKGEAEIDLIIRLHIACLT